ncbi:MAG: hypothetical protein U1E66_10330 [Rhodospirillales bacterium]
MHRWIGFALFLLIAGSASPAAAYVGPGAGITMLGALWAVIAAVFLALGGLIAWPLRRILRRSKTPAGVPAVERPVSADTPSH